MGFVCYKLSAKHSKMRNSNLASPTQGPAPNPGKSHTLPFQAIILAAGLGKRLAALLPDKPKGFIEFSGLPIVERSIQQLLAVGVTEIGIVTGYMAKYYIDLAQRYSCIHLIHNSRYAESGSMYSLYCASSMIHNDFLLLESDLVYENRALQAMMNVAKPNVILVSGWTSSGDEVYVTTLNDRVLKISKRTTDRAEASGELVGISRISYQMYQSMVQYARRQFADNPNLAYEDCISDITDGVDVSSIKIDDLVWGEIDMPSHYQRVKKKILPRVMAEWTM